MRSKLVLIALGSVLAGCSTTDHPERGVAAVNVPVVNRADYVFDAAAPGGALAPGEAERLDGWFRGLEVRYGDSIYVDGPYADMARAQVAEVAGRYGLMVTPGAPVTTGAVPPGAVRIVVSRAQAGVPNCPNWRDASQPNWENKMLSNFGCSVNANLAAQVANPVDLIHGREALGASDARTATKPVSHYRNAPPTGTKGLQDISTKKDDQ